MSAYLISPGAAPRCKKFDGALFVCFSGRLHGKKVGIPFFRDLASHLRCRWGTSLLGLTHGIRSEPWVEQTVPTSLGQFYPNDTATAVSQHQGLCGTWRSPPAGLNLSSKEAWITELVRMCLDLDSSS